MANEPTPQILGRFNYVCRVKGLFNVIFFPYEGASAIIIARDLPDDECKSLIYALNQELIETEKVISTPVSEEKKDE